MISVLWHSLGSYYVFSPFSSIPNSYVLNAQNLQMHLRRATWKVWLKFQSRIQISLKSTGITLPIFSVYAFFLFTLSVLNCIVQSAICRLNLVPEQWRTLMPSFSHEYRPAAWGITVLSPYLITFAFFYYIADVILITNQLIYSTLQFSFFIPMIQRKFRKFIFYFIRLIFYATPNFYHIDGHPTSKNAADRKRPVTGTRTRGP